jgi:hypothetical protein
VFSWTLKDCTALTKSLDYLTSLMHASLPVYKATMLQSGIKNPWSIDRHQLAMQQTEQRKNTSNPTCYLPHRLDSKSLKVAGEGGTSGPLTPLSPVGSINPGTFPCSPEKYF